MDLKVYTPEEAAKILKLSPKTVRKYLREGELKGAKLGKEWRITEEQLREFLARRSNPSEWVAVCHNCGYLDPEAENGDTCPKCGGTMWLAKRQGGAK